ncbi:MAG: hypothetical protein PUC88_01185 [Clostridia bacterium]|nr:hypothetical protein [Clostridia bacterium]
MKYEGTWLIAGSYDAGKIIDFELQMKKELPSLSYSDIAQSDPELQQTLTIDTSGVVELHTNNESNEVISGKIENDTINFGDEIINTKIEDGYLVFCTEGGFVFKKI